MKRRGRPRYPDVLTPRQFEVLELLRRGYSNDEIAQRLGISRDGAKFHVSEILGKLAVSSRGEAARWAQQRDERRAAPSAMLARGGGWRLAGRRHERARCRRRRSRHPGRGFARGWARLEAAA